MASDRLPHAFPKFDTVEEERRHRKQRLAAAFRLFGRFGFDEGTAGHITARDPELLDHFWVNPLGMSFRQIRVKDLLLVEPRGRGRRGHLAAQRGGLRHPLPDPRRPPRRGRPPPTRTRCTARRGPRCTARSTRSTQDACAFYGDHAVFDDYTGAVLDLEEGKRIAHALGDGKAAILANHGLLTVGRTVDEAAWWFVTMERIVPGPAAGRGRRHPGA